MSIVFYTAPQSSAVPVACTLAELGLQHERIVVDLKSGALKKPEFLALNPNGKVPTLVVDGTPMFESLAIMQWLGDRYGVAKGLWPAADSPVRLAALSWSTWTYVTLCASLQRLALTSSSFSPAELHHAALAEYSRAELAQQLTVLEQRLGAQPHMLGDAYSLVDTIVSCMVRYGTLVGLDTKPFPKVREWVDRCQSRPAIRAEWP